MCGRFSLQSDREKLEAQFHASCIEFKPRYNIAPGQNILALCQDDKEFKLLHWGLKPTWSRTGTSTLINVRAETAEFKFRQMMQYRRCIIPADGFYVWKVTDTKKQPYYIQAKDKSLLAFAGLWEVGSSNQTSSQNCVILTCEASTTLRPIHHRMPVILKQEDYAIWLDPQQHDIRLLSDLLRPAKLELHTIPVSSKVNYATYDEPDCISPL
jgi:putative SOS response-associated peptidase YedK